MDGTRKIPVILDTDIGDDIDDTWALAMMLNSPEVDVKLILTDLGNTPDRAKIVAKLLDRAHRTDIPVGIGLHQNNNHLRHGLWAKDYDLSEYPGTVYRNGIDAMIDIVMSTPVPVTLIAIGPTPNLAQALQRTPSIAHRIRLVGMQGSIHRGYGGKPVPDPEYNVARDIASSKAVFSAPWDMTITPLDTCGVVQLTGRRYAAVHECRDPLARAVIENYRVWAEDPDSPGPKPDEGKSSILFDTVAVYLAFSDEFLRMERLGIRITDDGLTIIDEGAKKIDCAMEWKDLEAFQDLVVERVIGK